MMDFSSLPEEVFVEIALHLELDDLLSCSLVSSSWRNAVNQNKIWFTQCAERSALNRDRFELISAPQKVPPPFAFPVLACDTLPELCQWRKRFMQEAHISRNWRFGRYTSEFIAAYKYECMQVVECEESSLIIGNIKNRQFTVFDISESPEKVETIPYSLWHVASDFFKLCQNKLVIVQCTLLQIYEKTPENNFVLTHRVLFNKPQEDSYCIPESPDVSDWYRNNIGLYPSDLNFTCDHNGKYFTGLILEDNLNTAVFHIWNLNSGLKVAEEQLPSIEDNIVDIHFTSPKSNLYMLFKLIDETRKEYTSLYCYDLEKFEFSSFVMAFDYVVPVMLFTSHLVLTIDLSGKSIILWKNDTGKFVDKITCKYEIHPMTLQTASSFILLSSNFSNSSLIKVYDTNLLQTVSKFETNYKVTNLLMIRSNLILAGGWMELGLWDMKTSCKLYTMSYCDCIWTNYCKSKAVVESDGELFLVHFW